MRLSDLTWWQNAWSRLKEWFFPGIQEPQQWWMEKPRERMKAGARKTPWDTRLPDRFAIFSVQQEFRYFIDEVIRINRVGNGPVFFPYFIMQSQKADAEGMLRRSIKKSGA